MRLLVGLAVAWSLGCTPGEPPASARTPARPNLVLVTLDTTRADRLGCYGYPEAETRRVDGLAREGALVERAIAPAPTTLPSHASLLTGLYPPRHGARDNSDFRVPPAETTLAEHLRDHGYRTAAVLGSVVLAASRGLAQGFEIYDEPRPPPSASGGEGKLGFSPIAERRASEVTDQALAALERTGGGPFFLWVHYFDPHADYAPPSPYKERFAARPYDGEIAYTDAELGRLLDALARRGVLDQTLVVVAADHGESLGEHAEETHGIFLYDATLRVPLIFRLPGAIAPGGRIGRLVSLVDVAPTALELMGLDPMLGLQGESFAAALRGTDQPARAPVYAEAIYPARAYGWAPIYALRDLSVKFIEAPEPEVYDLARDPHEQRNLAPSRSGDVDTWRERLADLRRGFGEASADASDPLSTEERERLASLGYVSLATPPDEKESRSDPKRRVAEHNAHLAARALLRQGRLPEAEDVLRRVLEADPANPTAVMLRGAVAFSQGRKAEGLGMLEEAARLAPGVAEVQWTRAQALHNVGRLPEAASGYRTFLALEPDSVRAYTALGDVLGASGDAAGAAKAYEAAIGLGFDAPIVRAALGAALAASGSTEDGERELRAAVSEDPTLAVAWQKLGALAEQRGRLKEAVGHYGKALEAAPDNPHALLDHARLSLRTGDRATARREVERLLAGGTRDPQLDAAARALLRQLEGHSRPVR